MGWTGTIINGVLLGGLYGLFGVGLALVFGVTRIVNIMHGEFIALSAFIALGIAALFPDAHPLLLILPVVVISFALGYALQAVFVNRSMRLPDPLAPLLLTFGLSVIVRNLMIEGFGVNPRHIRAGDFGQLSIDVFGVPVGVLPLVTLALAVGLFVFLQVLLRRTKLGRIVRATADNAEIVRLMGVRPASVYNIVMGLSFALAGVAGLMLALRTTFTPFSGVERLLISFEVVVMGGLGSFWGAMLADRARRRATGRASPQSQFRFSVRQSRLLRFRHAAPERPVWSAAVRKQVVPIATLGVFVALAVAAPWLVGDGGVGLLFEVLLMLAMAQLWNLLAGYTGLVSMGLQCFVGLGGYTTIFAANTLSVSPYWVLPLAPIVCGLIGAASALFLFRLRDAYFSISTWVFAEVVAMLVFIAPGLGHVTGMTLTTARGIDYEIFLLTNFWIAAALAAGVVIGIYALLHSPLGLGMLSVRDDDIAAASVGVNVWRNRFIAYVAAAAGCGLAGGISFMAALFITVTTGFDLNWVVAMIFIVIIGGIGTLEGPIVGTAIYYVLTNVFALSGSWYLVTLGAVAVTAMLVAPRGIWPFVRDRFGIEWLTISRKLADAATPAGAATITPDAATSPERI